MKKIILGMIICLCLTGCSKNEYINGTTNNEKLNKVSLSDGKDESEQKQLEIEVENSGEADILEQKDAETSCENSNTYTNIHEENFSKEKYSEIETLEKEQTVEDKVITISFAGDCTLGTYKGQSGNTTFDKIYNENGPEYFFANVKDIFENDDLTLINLEGPLTDRTQTANKEFPIRGEKEYVEILVNGSVEVANLSNNHTYDCGQAGFDETKEVLTTNNIGFIGEGNIFTTEINGVKIGMLGYKIFNINSSLKETIKNDIEKLKHDDIGIICVMTHGGTPERIYESNTDQENISRYIIDCGADIVVGGHPHVLQGIEIYNNKFICYSLGNFSFGANKNPSDKDTFIYQQKFIVKEDGQVDYGESKIIPCKISSRDDINNYQPTPVLDADEALRILDKISKHSLRYTNGWKLNP